MRIETVAVHAGTHVDPGTGAVAQAIHPSTTFERDPDGSYPRGFLYSRNNNPNREALEECLAALEGGAAAAAFSSASAATSAVLLALEPGDHVVAPMDAYHGTSRLLRETFARWKLETTFVDMTDLAAVRAAMRASTRLVWVETPSNPLWKITDLAAVGEIARQAGARYVCDNTTATPVLQTPLRLGADLVVHATTKYLGGHGDVLGGAVVSKVRDELFERIRAVQASAGAVPGRHVPARPPEGRSRPLSRAADPRGARRRAPPDDGVRRDDVGAGARGPGAGDGRRGQAPRLHTRHQLRRDRESRRAPRVDRRRRHAHSGQSLEAVDRSRAPGRLDRRSRAGIVVNNQERGR